MRQDRMFLPDFNAAHIESYFDNDFAVIMEVFKITDENLQDDLNEIQKAFENKDFHSLKSGIHKIKPVFVIAGLTETEQEVNGFYSLCLRSSLFEEISNEYTELRPKLIRAKSLIHEQSNLFQSYPEKYL